MKKVRRSGTLFVLLAGLVLMVAGSQLISAKNAVVSVDLQESQELALLDLGEGFTTLGFDCYVVCFTNQDCAQLGAGRKCAQGCSCQWCDGELRCYPHPD